ncbi:AAA family ATPase [Bifidobacterium rousetti]|uniref:AAA family ATPase n=1 Tax=Bifidobacterium rousetti TaxID=2045439 RepID=UPI0012392026|nr:MoxR family ATPase [Bifidobacterium rousetti]KAA8818164.1 AAA family ATPase [Bifidobacterium rousetti]
MAIASDSVPQTVASSSGVVASASQTVDPAGPDVQELARVPARIADELERALSCSREVIDLAVTTFAAGGHLLLEDVPGVGKTTLARALALAVGGDVHRVQFTPDMLPSDLTGVNIWSGSENRFVFHPGPLFANVVIADEINRANPKTQSAMLEAMSEGQISVDGVSHALPEPYFVVATQNPIELEGTYPLPEAQLDRFMACTSFGYPESDAESRMITANDWSHPLGRVEQVCDPSAAVRLRAAARRVTVAGPVADYIVALSHATRERDGVRYGASPRASLFLAAMARARAMFDGRSYVLPDDVQQLAVPVLAHRLVLDDIGYGGESLATARAIVSDILHTVPVPRV